MIDLVKYPVLTEKSTRLLENNQYTFDVDLRLTKTKIKALIEELFEVKVLSVNTHRAPRKKQESVNIKGSVLDTKELLLL